MAPEPLLLGKQDLVHRGLRMTCEFRLVLFLCLVCGGSHIMMKLALRLETHSGIDG